MMEMGLGFKSALQWPYLFGESSFSPLVPSNAWPIQEQSCTMTSWCGNFSTLEG